MKKLKGFGLVEILVAMTLGLILLLALTQVLSNSSRANRLLTGYTTQNENSRLAQDVIVRALNYAGNFSGLDPRYISRSDSLSITAKGDCNLDWALDIRKPIQIFSGADNVSSITDFPSRCLLNEDYQPNTDILVVRYADPSLRWSEASAAQQRMFVFKSIIGLDTQPNAGEIYYASGNTSTNSTASETEEIGINILTYRVEIYFIRPCNHEDGANANCTHPLPTLSVMRLHERNWYIEPLVENIEQLKFYVGTYNAATLTTNFAMPNDIGFTSQKTANSIQFSLLSRSPHEENSHRSDASYTLAGNYEHFVPSEEDNNLRHYIRRVHTKTVKPRNLNRLTIQ